MYKFDLRMPRVLDNYHFHEFPISDFDMGKRELSKIGVSSSMDKTLIPYDFRKSSSEHDGKFRINNGHQAVISKLNVNGMAFFNVSTI